MLGYFRRPSAAGFFLNARVLDVANESANDSERTERCRIDTGSDRQTVVGLKTRDRGACQRTHAPVDRVLVISALLERSLNTGDNLFGRLTVVTVDRFVVVVVRIGIVTPGRVPPAVVPTPPAEIEKDDRGTMMPPPRMVVMMVTIVQMIQTRLVCVRDVPVPIS